MSILSLAARASRHLSLRSNTPLLTKEFPDFASALHACGAGYESNDIAAVVVEKTRRLVANWSDEVPPPWGFC